jgi:hypothetical protein
MFNESSHRLKMSHSSKSDHHEEFSNHSVKCFVCKLKVNTKSEILNDCNYKSLLVKSKYFYHTFLKKKTEKEINIPSVSYHTDSNLISPCTCPRFFHKTCLINYCLVNVTIQCPECKSTFAIGFSETHPIVQIFKILCIFLSLLLIHAGLLFISYLFFIGSFSFPKKYEFWQTLIGCILVLFNIFGLKISYKIFIFWKNESDHQIPQNIDTGKKFDEQQTNKLFDFMQWKFNCEKNELLEKKVISKIYSEFILKGEKRRLECFEESKKLFKGNKNLDEKILSLYSHETPQELKSRKKEKKIFLRDNSLASVKSHTSNSNSSFASSKKNSSIPYSQSLSSSPKKKEIFIKAETMNYIKDKQKIPLSGEKKKIHSTKEIKDLKNFEVQNINNLMPKKSIEIIKTNPVFIHKPLSLIRNNKLDDILEEQTQNSSPNTFISVNNKLSSNKIRMTENSYEINDERRNFRFPTGKSNDELMKIKLIPFEANNFKKSLFKSSSSNSVISIENYKNDKSKDQLIVKSNKSIENCKENPSFEEVIESIDDIQT